ncbi:hypothetical protein BKA60DRAFT_471947, partial [Fusarium oxysporum]
RELCVSIAACPILGRGILSDPYCINDSFEEGDAPASMSRQKGGDSKKKLEPVDKTNKVAELKGCTGTSSQLVLAWLLAQRAKAIVIPGTKRTECPEENHAARARYRLR